MPKRQRAASQNGDESDGAKRQRENRDAPPIPATYASASDSKKNNEFLTNLDIPDDDLASLRQIQTTYKVKLSRWADKGYVYEIKLVWDYNRLWGSFNFGSFFKGTFIVDPGPGVEYINYLNETADKKSYPLVWCGTSSQMPDTTFSSLLTTGEIQFDMGEISGHFDAMLSNDPFEFFGEKIRGPARVDRSLQSFIDDWNELSIIDDGESARTCLPSSPKDSSSPEPKQPKASRPPEKQVAKSDNKNDKGKGKGNTEISNSITGIFNIESSAIEKEWSRYSDSLSIRFHADPEQNTVWGRFNIGIYEGFILLDDPLDALKYNTPLKFHWRGRESETGDGNSDKGEVRITKEREVKGVFHGMCGEIDFSGRRKLMPSGISGYELWYYRNNWEEYKYGAWG